MIILDKLNFKYFLNTKILKDDTRRCVYMSLSRFDSQLLWSSYEIMKYDWIIEFRNSFIAYIGYGLDNQNIEILYH